MKIALLHPGAMGSSIAAALKSNNHQVYWITTGRSPATRERAKKLALNPIEGFKDLREMDAVVSICPPGAAESVANEVLASKFDGIYLDANAIAPSTATRLSTRVGSGFVDGGIIGPPAIQAGSTRLYLSGAEAEHVQDWFEGSALESIVVSSEPGAASALKMCYAAYTKGSAALILAVRALAEVSGVTDALTAEWSISQPGLEQRSERIAQGTGPKAWRFTAEMEEIAETFSSAQLPGEFHQAAAKIYRRLAALKDSPHPTLDDVLALLLNKKS